MRKWVTDKTVREALPNIGWGVFTKEFFSERELLILEHLDSMLALTLSASVRKLATELSISESTCKVILRKFRDAGLITAGNKQRQGNAIYLTQLGVLLKGGERNDKRL